jgi:hypothetical protein
VSGLRDLALIAASALQQVQKIQNNRPTEVRKSPLVELPKN